MSDANTFNSVAIFGCLFFSCVAAVKTENYSIIAVLAAALAHCIMLNYCVCFLFFWVVVSDINFWPHCPVLNYCLAVLAYCDR